MSILLNCLAPETRSVEFFIFSNFLSPSVSTLDKTNKSRKPANLGLRNSKKMFVGFFVLLRYRCDKGWRKSWKLLFIQRRERWAPEYQTSSHSAQIVPLTRIWISWEISFKPQTWGILAQANIVVAIMSKIGMVRNMFIATKNLCLFDTGPCWLGLSSPLTIQLVAGNYYPLDILPRNPYLS